MARVGPWTIRAVSWNPGTESCERCGRTIKRIWECSVDPADGRAHGLGGKLDWRIGSKCGPTLLEVSDQVWDENTKAATRNLALIRRLDELVTAAENAGVELPAVVEERRPLIESGQATDSQLRHLGLVIGRWRKELKLP